jgi:hypothetical protein
LSTPFFAISGFFGFPFSTTGVHLLVNRLLHTDRFCDTLK